MTSVTNWLLGRGASLACGLHWAVPSEFRGLERTEQIAAIKSALREAADGTGVDTRPYKDLLHILATETAKGRKHRFITTNWDDLLQREVLALDYDVLPSWLDDTHVYHLNGTIEELRDNSQRSPFVLETDAGSLRSQSPELSSAFDKMFWDELFIVVGMSFECEVDNALLAWLNQVEDETPIRNSLWLVVNPDEAALSASCENLQAALPRAKVFPSAMTLETWLASDLVALREIGVLRQAT